MPVTVCLPGRIEQEGLCHGLLDLKLLFSLILNPGEKKAADALLREGPSGPNSSETSARERAIAVTLFQGDLAHDLFLRSI